MIVAVTGHRPDKLWGYDLKHPKYKCLHDTMVNFLQSYNVTYCISGMALGVDTVFAVATLNYKKTNKNTILECAIPCLNHSSKWIPESQKLYNTILSKADVITQVSNEVYQPYLMQKRNEYMVDKCEVLLAIWDGSSGGTGNCVNYARKKNKEIVILKPSEIR